MSVMCRCPDATWRFRTFSGQYHDPNVTCTVAVPSEKERPLVENARIEMTCIRNNTKQSGKCLYGQYSAVWRRDNCLYERRSLDLAMPVKIASPACNPQQFTLPEPAPLKAPFATNLCRDCLWHNLITDTPAASAHGPNLLRRSIISLSSLLWDYNLVRPMLLQIIAG